MIGKCGKTVNAWENGRGQPDVDTLLLLCDIYGVDDIGLTFDEKRQPETGQFQLTAKEKNLVTSYRNERDMRNAVDRLLKIENVTELPKLHRAKKVARSTDNKTAPSTEYLTETEINRLENCPEDDTL